MLTRRKTYSGEREMTGLGKIVLTFIIGVGLYLLFTALTGCTTQPTTPTPPVVVDPTPVPNPGDVDISACPSTGWCAAYDTIITSRVTPAMINVPTWRMEPLCPRWQSFTTAEKTKFWAQFAKSLARHESSLNPRAMYWEKTMPNDSITGQITISEGLVMLSYQDAPNYGCSFPYAPDKAAFLVDVAAVKANGSGGVAKSLTRSTINPNSHLDCYVRIVDTRLKFTNATNANQNIILLMGGEYRDGSYKGGYWAVLRDEKLTKYGALSKVRASLKTDAPNCYP